jgi:hypothetical protein
MNTFDQMALGNRAFATGRPGLSPAADKNFGFMRILRTGSFAALIAAVVFALAATAFAATRPALTQDWFYVGGHYEDTADGTILTGQMYTQVFTPAQVTHKYPIILIHGGGGTGATYEKTADGRPG